MSFKDEVSVTLLFCCVVLAFTTSYCYFNWQETRDANRELRIELAQYQGEYDEPILNTVL